jgi:hypothetical protein
MLAPARSTSRSHPSASTPARSSREPSEHFRTKGVADQEKLRSFPQIFGIGALS